jgi:hypothetical protein
MSSKTLHDFNNFMDKALNSESGIQKENNARRNWAAAEAVQSQNVANMRKAANAVKLKAKVAAAAQEDAAADNSQALFGNRNNNTVQSNAVLGNANAKLNPANAVFNNKNY